MHITFNKDRYHQQGLISQWCVKNFGPGQWIGERYPKDWEGLPNWTIHCMFGQTTFAFKNEQDYSWFLLKWSSND